MAHLAAASHNLIAHEAESKDDPCSRNSRWFQQFCVNEKSAPFALVDIYLHLRMAMSNSIIQWRALETIPGNPKRIKINIQRQICLLQFKFVYFNLNPRNNFLCAHLKYFCACNVCGFEDASSSVMMRSCQWVELLSGGWKQQQCHDAVVIVG